tara:strand:- start:56 stop:499 length:444 start_codon:yes stop_codon:yes gene_type:complete
MLKAFYLIVITSMLSVTSSAHASWALGIKFGAPSVGRGGPNPLGIPPPPQDIEIDWVRSNGTEIVFSISPGIIYMIRTKIMDNLWFNYGSGLIISANGGGPGIATGFTKEFGCGPVKCAFDYKQAIGLGGLGITSPWSVRFGAMLWF